MKLQNSWWLAVAILAGCGAEPLAKSPAELVKNKLERVETMRDGSATASTYDEYKLELARRITEVNSTHIHLDQPQALLRSVIVLKYAVDAGGQLMRADIVRTNRDHDAETIALSTLRASAPFPKPATHLLQRGRIDITETWLFNKDGRFQLRSLARPQLGE